MSPQQSLMSLFSIAAWRLLRSAVGPVGAGAGGAGKKVGMSQEAEENDGQVMFVEAIEGRESAVVEALEGRE